MTLYYPSRAVPVAPQVRPPGRPPAKKYRVGLLFVHGMGQQERGDTITQMGDALTAWLKGWLAEVPGADFKIRGAVLRTGGTGETGPTDDTLGGQAHVAVTIITKPRTRETRQEWLLAESWWAGAFRPASFMELATWAIAVGPWLIASQRAGIGERVRLPTGPLGGLVKLVIETLLTLVGAGVAAVITPLALGLLVLRLVPIPVLSAATRGLAKSLSGSFGDLLVLVRSPVRFAAMAEQVRADIANVDARCDRVMVVAHSQGSAVAWHAIRRTADQPPKDRATVALFVSFGQALRKLKSLYRLQHGSGGTQFWFATLALLSTISLAFAAIQGIGLWTVIIEEQASVSAVLGRMLDGLYWLWLLGPIAAVLVIQGILTRMAKANDDAAEGEIRKEIAEVQEAFPEFRWEDLWASADPASNGPLLKELPARVDSYKIRNLASTILDHSAYWENTTEFVSAIAFAAASLAPPSAMGIRSAIPHELERAAIIRDHRVAILASGRVLLFGALAAGLYGLRRVLPDLGGWALDVLNAIPLLPDWFGDWNHILKGFVAAGLITVGAIVVWSLLLGGWTLVTRDDERAFFERREGRKWTAPARLWTVVATVMPAILILVLAMLRADPSIVAIYAAIAVAGLAGVVLLNSLGRRLGEPRPST